MPGHAAPYPVAASALPLPLHDSAASRRREEQALAQAAPFALMAAAGLATARLALAVAPHARHITVLAGPGNNGGDALVAARHLRRLGRAVTVLHLADTTRLPADAAQALQQARQSDLHWHRNPDDLPPGDLLIDGLLGLGSRRAPEGALAAAITASRRSTRPVLAIDLPSGLQPDTGQHLGEHTVQAHWTLALLTLKPGLFTGDGRDLAGQVWLDTLGSDGDAAGSATAWLGAATAAPPGTPRARRHAQHKGSFGDLWVVGGAPGMAGAALLAARAALTAGAGRVWLSALGPALTPLPMAELMHAPPIWQASATHEPSRLRHGTVVCGCGGGAAVAATLPTLLAQAGRLLLDADALNAIAADASLQAAVQARPAGSTVLTPHPLEAARLLGCPTAAVQADRLAAAAELARRYRAVVVLKGSGSIIAAPGGKPWINASGNAALATPGSGDVLAGWLGGTWSQQAGQAPRLSDEDTSPAERAARHAVWLHGRAADLQRPSASLPLRAGDLADAMAQAG